MPPLASAASRIFMRMPVVSCRSSASSEARTAVPDCVAPLICSASRRACMRSAVKTPRRSRRAPAAGGTPGMGFAPPGVGVAAVAAFCIAVGASEALGCERRKLSRRLLTASRSRREETGWIRPRSCWRPKTAEFQAANPASQRGGDHGRCGEGLRLMRALGGGVRIQSSAKPAVVGVLRRWRWRPRLRGRAVRLRDGGGTRGGGRSRGGRRVEVNRGLDR